MAEIKPSLELYHWSKDEPPSYNQSDFTGFWKNPKYGPNMAQKRFFDNISGTKSPRTKFFALLGSSYMTGSGWHPISIFLEISAGRICWATESRLLNEYLSRLDDSTTFNVRLQKQKRYSNFCQCVVVMTRERLLDTWICTKETCRLPRNVLLNPVLFFLPLICVFFAWKLSKR